LLIQPAATTIAVSIAIIAWPPPNTGYEDPIVEVIVEMIVVNEVIVIMAMPIAVPNIMTTIPGIMTRPTMPCRTKTAACDMTCMPTATRKARFAHSTKVRVSHTTEASAAHPTKMRSAKMATSHSAEVTAAKPVSGVCLPYQDRSKQ